MIVAAFFFVVIVKCCKGFFTDDERFEVIRDLTRENRRNLQEIIANQELFENNVVDWKKETKIETENLLDNIKLGPKGRDLEKIKDRLLEWLDIRFTSCYESLNQNIGELHKNIKELHEAIEEGSKRRLEILEAEKNLVTLKLKYMEIRKKGK